MSTTHEHGLGTHPQSAALRAAREQLQTLAGGDVEPEVALVALLNLDSTVPSYPPARVLAEGATYEEARRLIRAAIEESTDVLEITRLGDALDTLAIEQLPTRG